MKSVTERIRRSAEKYLDVSRREIIDEIIRLEAQRDTNGMRELFDAYKSWELRDPKCTDRHERLQLAQDNFDCVARVADGYLKTGDEYLAMVSSQQVTPVLGRVTTFYRSAIGYNPINPALN